jgi:hypothetical protein
MTALADQRDASRPGLLSRVWSLGARWALPACLIVVSSGCALTSPPGLPALSTGTAQTRECLAWYGALDAATATAGVRDAGAATIEGYPFLRVDRHSASLRNLMPASSDATESAPLRQALLARLAALDLQARQFEVDNLPRAMRITLRGPARGQTDPPGLMQRTRACSAQLMLAALAQPGQTHRMLRNLSVPDDYVTAYRVLGLYPLTRIPFFKGVRQHEDRMRTQFASAAPPLPDGNRLRLAPRWRPPPEQVTPEQLRAMVQPRADDPLGLPAPTPEQLETLFSHFAPVFDIAVDSDDDLPGALAWPGARTSPSPGTPIVDTRQPVVYRQVAYTRHADASLLQLVYTIWFGARTAMTQPIDLLAGRIDGLVWRVTLSPDGVPWVYDSMHPCGCYHQFFPRNWIQARPAPDPNGEWAFSPVGAPALQTGQRMALRVASATHYLTGLDVLQRDPALPYDWRSYDSLRSLPAADGTRRSVFNAHGFIPGTDRLESWLFWPMGIAQAGSMRQWGRHATAFVGKRHFDDAYLLDERYIMGEPVRDE